MPLSKIRIKLTMKLFFFAFFDIVSLAFPVSHSLFMASLWLKGLMSARCYLHLIQSAARLYTSSREAVVLRQNEALDSPIQSIISILRFTVSLLLFPTLFLALDRGLKYLLIIGIDWLVVVSSFDAYSAFRTTADFLGVLKEESMQENARAITNTMVATLFTAVYEIANICARVYVLTTLAVRYHSMHRKVDAPPMDSRVSKGSK